MHSIPPHSHPAREMFSLEDLVAVSNGQIPVHCSKAALRRMATPLFKNKAIKRLVYFLVDGSNDQLQLASIGPRGGIKIEWTFGPITRATKLL